VKESINTRVYNKIKEDIMHLELKPKEEVSVQKLADAYGASRTPIREAVLKLSQEGLVNVKPQAKTIIQPISEERVKQENFIRKSLELSAVPDFLYNCSPYTLDTLDEMIEIQRRAIKKNKILDFCEIDHRFHKLLFNTASKELAYQVIESSATHSQRLFFLRAKQSGVSEEIVEDYKKMVDNMRSGKEELLERMVDGHIEQYYSVGNLKKQYPDYFV